jgi:hypothetical protein
MPTTFQKRQKEMKRLDKQKMKAERRAQKKVQPRSEGGPPIERMLDSDLGLEPESDPASE